MPCLRHILIACLALAVAGDFAWHFYEGDPDRIVRPRDLRRAPPLKAGDLVLIARTGAAGNLMRLAAKTPWTHVALVVSDNPPLLASAQQTDGMLGVRIEGIDVERFAARAEEFALARISPCAELCAKAASVALGEIGKKEKTSFGAQAFGTLSGASFVARSFNLPEKDLAKASDGSEKPVLPEDILSRLGAKIIFSTRKN